MITLNKNFISGFFERNLFERLIVYIFLSELAVKLIFELALGQWSFKQSQNTQWIFYGFLAADYLISVRKVMNIRFTLNPMSAVAFLFVVMIAHGTLVGVLNHNPPFVIFNDFIPPLMIVLNILRMQSTYENNKPIDVRFLLAFCTAVALSTTLIGFLCMQIGLPSEPSVGRGQIFFPLVLSTLFVMRPFPRWIAFSLPLIFLLTATELNRTSISFLIIVIGGYSSLQIVRNPAKGVLLIVMLCIVISLAVAFMPKDSGTYRRISGLSEIDLSERTGSIGERQAEWDAIKAKLADKGKTAEWTGLGFGGLYNVRFTHQYNTNYGHAHYIWAWFNMRFGKIGYIYMALMMSALVYNTARGLFMGSDLGLFVSFLNLIGLIYCMTHVNSLFLLSGLNFLHLASTGQKLKPALPGYNR
ncbi:MAG TPA: hypothetical protein DEA55_05805 [Rhodospirillaceae bacterium]|nr:hypothetical protein [Rhodospirillaceae bacterium]